MFIFRKSRPALNVILGSLIMAFSLYSCNEIVEEDISGKTVTIISPSDGYSSPSNQVVFWWNKLDGADWYNLQIVKPSFNNVQIIVTDTNVTGENFTCLLSFGDYQWRIRPENSAYEGDYVVRSFSVESDSDLTYQVVPLVLPIQNDTSNLSAQNFSWQALPYADSYTLTVWQNYYGGAVVYNTSITGTNQGFSFVSDGSYEWGVKAVNAESESEYSLRKILIDTQAPATPALILPNNGDTLSAGSIDFSWSHSSGGSSIRDSILIAKDITFDTLVFSGFTANQAITFNLSAGSYYWKVKSFDAAGNESSWTAYRRIIID